MASNQKHKKILSCLKQYPEGATPKVIAFNTGINVNTVKSILPKLPSVHKVMRGLYKVVLRGDGISASALPRLRSWNFHNCVLSSTTSSFIPKLIHQLIVLDLLNLEFTITQKGRITLRVSSDYPLNVSSISLLVGYLSELLKSHNLPPVTPKEVKISTIEFNKDYSNLRLDGLRCLTVDSLIEQFKVYQKSIGLRIEHKTKIPFTAENVIQMLTSNPRSLETEVRLLKQSQEIKRMKSALAQTNLLLKQLLEVKDATHA